MELTIWIFLTLTLLQIWLLLYMNNKKVVFSIPYLLIIFISPFYTFLDQNLLADVFGCACVPVRHPNMLNLPFNANDLRIFICSLLIIISTIIGIKLSKKINDKTLKVMYIVLILAINIIFSLLMNYINWVR